MPGLLLTPGELAGYAYQAGFRGTSLVTAVAVALAESGGRLNATNLNTDGSVDNGPWQVNTVHGQYSASLLKSDPAYSAKAAFEISNQGRDFTPWVDYKNGRYKEFLPAAQGASKNLANPNLQLPATGNPATPAGLFSSPINGIRNVVLNGVFTLAGFGLIIGGVYVMFRPQIHSAASIARKGAAAAAVAA
jgi:Lysozyme like domain